MARNLELTCQARARWEDLMSSLPNSARPITMKEQRETRWLARTGLREAPLPEWLLLMKIVQLV